MDEVSDLKSGAEIKSVGLLSSSVNAYLDWGVHKPHTILIDNNKSVVGIESVEELKDCLPKSDITLESITGVSVWCEAGCPHNFLWQLVAKGYRVLMCDPKEVMRLRGEREKSDELDVVLIRQLALESPDSFRELAEPEYRDLQLRFLMDKYVHFMQDCVRFQLRQKAYEREFDEEPAYGEILYILERMKKEALGEVQPHMKEDLKKVEDIKGVGLRFLAGLLAVAHPKRFSTLSRYLAYCGYKQSSWRDGSNKYSRVAKTLAWQMTKSMIMQKDPRFYSLYLKIKEDLHAKNPDYAKGKIDGMARNRVSTFLLKELYSRFHQGTS